MHEEGEVMSHEETHSNGSDETIPMTRVSLHNS